MKMKYYIKATGSVCYDKSGITFPLVISVDYVEILSRYQISDIIWENQYGWSNQPEVLCFSAEEENIKQLNEEIPVGLLVVEHWDMREYFIKGKATTRVRWKLGENTYTSTGWQNKK